MAKNVKEWYIDTIFGKVAMISWGESTYPPMLLLHGFMDSAATFIPLLELLPYEYYYVSFDLPGHGKSDPLPVGPPPSHATMVEVVRAVDDHMEWSSFVLLAHSMRSIIGIFFVLMDITETSSLITYDKAVSRTMTARDLTRNQAEIVLSRTLVPVTKDLYRYSTQACMKKLGLFHIQPDTLFAVLLCQPPMLTLVASVQKLQTNLYDFTAEIYQILKREHNSLFIVEGHHDVHIANPENLTPYIVDFLKSNNLLNYKKGKL